MNDTDNPKHAELADLCTSKVVGIIDDQNQVEAVRTALVSAGFAEHLIEVFCALEEAHDLDLRGGYHGLLHHIKSKLHHRQLLERRQMDCYENALLARQCVIQVHADAFCWKDTHQVFKSCGVSFVNSYGQLTTQVLEP